MLAVAAALAGAIVAQFLGEDACLDAGGMVSYTHQSCADGTGHQTPLRAPRLVFAILGAGLVVSSWGVRQAMRRHDMEDRPRPAA